MHNLLNSQTMANENGRSFNALGMRLYGCSLPDGSTVIFMDVSRVVFDRLPGHTKYYASHTGQYWTKSARRGKLEIIFRTFGAETNP